VPHRRHPGRRPPPGAAPELGVRLAETLGAFSSVSFGSLYPALNRLEAAGAVKAVEANEDVPVPMTGSLGAELAAFARGAGVRGSGPGGRRLLLTRTP